ncbi:hypothetical protein LTR64_005632 [Lithohypha guttulata]|uniref:uncharacterized protein n=1 Tax=Lithohypha guttulata TaxID=1690604 RepID=UPI00315DE928
MSLHFRTVHFGLSQQSTRHVSKMGSCLSSRTSLRTLASHTDLPKSRRRLKFDATEPMTIKESLKIEQKREARKSIERETALYEATQNIPTFTETLKNHGKWPLNRVTPSILQVNIGKLCNLTCHHCHVESGPTKVRENMDAQTVQRCIELVQKTPSIETVDITGGAPELNPHFRTLVVEARKLGKSVIDRCNLVVLFEKGQEDLAPFLAENGVHVVASLPCYTEDNTDKQRGRRVFEDSIDALKTLNRHGYGQQSSPLRLDLVYNPLGPNLPGPQSSLNAAYHDQLFREHGIVFNSLLTITNMPIRRFADSLLQSGQYLPYMELLTNSFNVSTVDQLMCRNTINVAWDGKIYDCDFNAAMGMGRSNEAGQSVDLWNIDSLDDLTGNRIYTGKHCLGCTAGAGSSCGGALE